MESARLLFVFFSCIVATLLLLLCSGALVLAKLKLRAVFGKMLLAAMKKLSETDFE